MKNETSLLERNTVVKTKTNTPFPLTKLKNNWTLNKSKMSTETYIEIENHQNKNLEQLHKRIFRCTKTMKKSSSIYRIISLKKY